MKLFPRVVYTLYRSLNKVLRLLNLGFLLLIFPRDFEQDGLATSRMRPFSDDPEFLMAKKKTIDSVGQDFKIDWRSHTFVWAFKCSLSLPGVAIELGTGKAWMFTFLLHHDGVNSIGEAFLIDRYSSMDVDKVSGQVIHGSENMYYTSNLEELRQRFAGEQGVRLVQGELPEVLNTLPGNQVRFVHVDLNAAQPEVDSLRILWSRIVPGGIVLLDDFGSPEFIESNRAMRALGRELGFTILGLPTGQGLIIKSHLKL